MNQEEEPSSSRRVIPVPILNLSPSNSVLRSCYRVKDCPLEPHFYSGGLIVAPVSPPGKIHTISSPNPPRTTPPPSCLFIRVVSPLWISSLKISSTPQSHFKTSSKIVQGSKVHQQVEIYILFNKKCQVMTQKGSRVNM